MRFFIYLLVLNIVSSVCLQASTFLPITLEQQIAGSDGGVDVELVSNDSYRIKNTVFTKYTFKILDSYQINRNAFEGNKLVLDLPGGTYKGVTTAISGAPVFQQGEKVFLFLKKVDGQYYLSNYSVGKFNYQKIDGEDYLINEVFPFNPNIGRVKKTTLLDRLKIKNESYSVNEVNENLVDTKFKNKEADKTNNRKIASTENKNLDNGNYFIIITALLGVVIVTLLLSKGKNEGE